LVRVGIVDIGRHRRGIGGGSAVGRARAGGRGGDRQRGVVIASAGGQGERRQKARGEGRAGAVEHGAWEAGEASMLADNGVIDVNAANARPTTSFGPAGTGSAAS